MNNFDALLKPQEIPSNLTHSLLFIKCHETEQEMSSTTGTN